LSTVFSFSGEVSDPLLEDQVLKEKYEVGLESEEDKQQRLREAAEHLIRMKHHRAKRLDFLLALTGLFLASFGTLVVILVAYYLVD